MDIKHLLNPSHHADSPSKPATISQQTQSLFFCIPPELRVQIYTLALHVEPHEDSPHGICLLHSPQHLVEENTVLSLLATCKIINHEATSIFYHDHPLVIRAISLRPLYSVPYQPTGFLETSPTVRTSSIRRLTVRLGDVRDATMACERLAKFCPKLTTLGFVLPERSEFELLKDVKHEWTNLKDVVATMQTVNDLWFVRADSFRLYREEREKIELERLCHELREALPRRKAERVIEMSQAT